MFATSETYPWSYGTHIFHNGQPRDGGDRKIRSKMVRKLTDFQVLQKDVEQYREKLTVAKLLHIKFDKCSGGSQRQSEFKDLTNDTYS